jgi:sulfur dioxygenase
MHRATGSAIALSAAAGAENVTLPLRHGDRVAFGSRQLEVRSTPGHTNSCLSFVLDDQAIAFTGDALLVRGCGRCDFQQGDAATLYRAIRDQILSLPDHCQLYPGHDYSGRMVTSVAEEKAFNPRLGGSATERDFVGFLDNMKLPHPHRIAEALPGNLRCGRPRQETENTTDAWGPVRRSYAGLPELDAAWVVEHRPQLTLLDVRSNEEFNGPDGHIPGSQLIPLPELLDRLPEIPLEHPVVVVCHAGSRSGLAAQQLLRAGLEQVASLHGGISRWQAEGYPIER